MKKVVFLSVFSTLVLGFFFLLVFNDGGVPFDFFRLSSKDKEARKFNEPEFPEKSGAGGLKNGNMSRKRLGLEGKRSFHDRKKISCDGHPLKEKPLAVEVFLSKGGKDLPCPGAKIVVRPYSGPGSKIKFPEEISENKKKTGFAESRVGSRAVFTCNRMGNAYLPLVSMARKNGSSAYLFDVRAFSSDGKFSSEQYTIEVDKFDRIRKKGRAFTGYLKNRWRIQVFPERRVLIFVRDKAGHGVSDVPVGLFHPGLPLGQAKMGFFIGKMFSGKTNRKGRCAFIFPFSKRNEENSKWLFAGFDFPLRNPGRWFKRITGENLRGKEIVLPMPPTGSVEIEVKGWGKIKESGKRFWVRVEPKSRNYLQIQKGFISMVPQNFFSRECRMVRGGRAVFDFVGTGTDLCGIGFQEDRWEFSKIEFSGPSFPGERIKVSLPRPPPSPSISGVLLGLDGKPCKNGEFRVYGGHKYVDMKTCPRRHMFLKRLRTDSQGRFSISLPPSFFFQKYPLSQVMIEGEGNRGEIWPPFCVIDLPPPFKVGDRNLGIFRLDAPPLLVEGETLDIQGKAVEGAEVQCFRPRVRNGKNTWERVISALSVSDPKGHWFIKGFWKWPQVMVMAIKEGEGSSDRLMVRPGTRGVRLVLSGGGGVEAKVMVSKKVYLQRKMVECLLFPRNLWWNGSNQKASKKVFPDGRIVWKNLLPGTYELRICAQGDPERPLVRVPGIQVAPGKVTRDPRIQDLDIRGLVEECMVVAKDPSGKILDPGHMWIKSESWAGSMLAPSKKGLIVLRRAGDAPRLEIVYPGYKERIVQGKGKVVEVILQPIAKNRRKGRQ